jgi:hypothetical protein
MAVFVINEWLWADSSGENGLQAQRETFNFVTQFAVSEHRMVFIEGSAFDQKAWKLCKSTNVIVGAIASAFVRSVRQNSDRCLILKPEGVITIPDELAAATKPEDHYLLHAMMSVGDSILITTDGPLREAVSRAGLACFSREDFFRIYF